MKRIDRILLALGLSLALAGCAAPAASQAFIDPAAGPSLNYSRFVAYAAFKDLAVEGRFEKALCKRLRQAGAACTTMLSLASPTKSQNAASRLGAADRSGAQAILVIDLANPDTLSRRLLDNARLGFVVSLVNVERQHFVARFTIDPRKAQSLDARAAVVAMATVSELQRNRLLAKM